MGESNCNNVKSAISTSLLILLIMSLSCSEKFSALSNAFDRISSASLSWSTNHLMSFDTFFIILFFWFYFAKIQKNPNNRIPFYLSYIFRALINILPLLVTFSKTFSPIFLRVSKYCCTFEGEYRKSRTLKQYNSMSIKRFTPPIGSGYRLW